MKAFKTIMEGGGDEAILERVGVGGSSWSELVQDLSLVSDDACSFGDNSDNILEALLCVSSCQQPKPNKN